jgi:N-acetylglucosaminyldiphosphoundecaprenol N-acetyl-beta-D-mannosaminyltransferase
MKGTENILGWPVSTMTLTDCLRQIESWLIGQARARYFVCANPHSLEVARDDAEFSRSIMGAGLVIPDGIGIVLASRIFGGCIHQRVTGSEIFSGVSKFMNQRGDMSCFFLGSSDHVLAKISARMKVDYPRIRVVGTYSPPFKAFFQDEDDRRMVEAVNRARPDVLWVGMTAPKQEKWIARNRGKLDVPFIGAVGAVFDFYGGTVRRSHPFVNRLGLEWLARMLRQPRRLWRRNIISNPIFMARVITERLRRALLYRS